MADPTNKDAVNAGFTLDDSHSRKASRDRRAVAEDVRSPSMELAETRRG
jgi:hypothetical protein